MFNLSVKVNPKQKSILFDAMLRHKHILEGRSFALRSSKNDLWEKLARQLNMHGPEKDVAQWKKCWTDLRLAIKKKYQKAKRHRKRRGSLTDFERHVVRACGIQVNTVAEVESSPIINEVIDDTDIKQEQAEERDINKFEEVNVPAGDVASGQDLMRGTIKIEDTELFQKEFASENESLFLSRESLNHERSTPTGLQTPRSEIDTAGGRDLQERSLIEIRRMHHNLLRESKKQTALLRKLVNRLAQ